MKTIYLECAMGAAGDMPLSALTELMESPEAFVDELNALQIPRVKYVREHVTRQGIAGAHMRVLVDGEEERPAPDAACPRAGHMHAHGEGHAHTHTHSHAHAPDLQAPHSRPDHDCHDHEHGIHPEHAPSHNGRHSNHGHAHTALGEITALIENLEMPERAKQDALAVYRLLAEAEGRAHGRPVDLVHFHEVGAMDAVADIAGCAYALFRLAPSRITASPVQVGGGFVRCAHGVLPVPTPATASLLEGIPIYSGEFHMELCTPTGAALLRHFVSDFGPLPMTRTSRIGYGMGTKELGARLNCVRAFLGETEEQTEGGQVCELVCTLDDMTPESLGAAMERLFEEGALDVCFLPAQMKKNRPGVQLICLCVPEQREHFVSLLFRHTTTRGVRARVCPRYTLPARFESIPTRYGDVRIKISGEKCKPEYDDVQRLAREHGESFQKVAEAAYAAFLSKERNSGR